MVSDGRGQTGAAVLQAALVQFQSQQYTIVREGNVRTKERIEEIVIAAAQAPGVVFYTLVEAETRRAMQRAAASHGVAAVDILGPALSCLHDLFKRAPQAEPGLLYASERENFDRHDAIDYTLKHDDGRRPHGLAIADVVLVGVSRASKSSTCFYLAYHGIKAANVPLVPGLPLPPELLALPKERVIGLWINPTRLVTIREARAHNLGRVGKGSYTEFDAVKEETRTAYRIMNERGWQTIDASYLAVEEIAHKVIRLRGLSESNLG